MTDIVTININAQGIADVRLNRADKYNALNSAMFRALAEAGEALKENKNLRAVVLSGEGKGFCAGLDMTAMMSESGGPAGKQGNRFQPQGTDIANFFQKPAFIWNEIPVPVIAAIHGAAYGGGFQIAMGADIRIGRHDAKLSIMEIKWGLIPDMSACATLPNICSLAVAKELTYTGRIVEAEEALRLGLINHKVDDHLASAFELAEVIASKSPDAIRMGKQLLEQTWQLAPREALQKEAILQRQLIGKPNQMEAVMSNMQKRPAQYRNPE